MVICIKKLLSEAGLKKNVAYKKSVQLLMNLLLIKTKKVY